MHLLAGVLLLISLTTANPSGTPGSDETDLATSGGASLDGGRLTDVLMITTTVGMLNGIHGNTTNLGPGVPLHLVLVVRTASLEDGLVDPSATCHNTHHGAIGGREDLLGATWELHTGLLRVRIVGNHGGVVSGRARQTATITGLLLQIAHNGTFGHLTHGHHVSNLQISLAATVHKLSGVHTLSSNEELLPDLVAIGIAEVHDGQWGTTTRIMDNILHDSLEVAMSLREVQLTELSGPLSLCGVCNKHRSRSFTLCTNYTSHFLWVLTARSQKKQTKSQ
uniref:Putative conserved secreted protein n=1 Tax=Lutzomyia longipalpis TaxID=7200 RepID=A0A7G3AG34_LUTLO